MHPLQSQHIKSVIVTLLLNIWARGPVVACPIYSQHLSSNSIRVQSKNVSQNSQTGKASSQLERRHQLFSYWLSGAFVFTSFFSLNCSPPPFHTHTHTHLQNRGGWITCTNASLRQRRNKERGGRAWSKMKVREKERRQFSLLQPELLSHWSPG